MNGGIYYSLYPIPCPLRTVSHQRNERPGEDGRCHHCGNLFRKGDALLVGDDAPHDQQLRSDIQGVVQEVREHRQPYRPAPPEQIPQVRTNQPPRKEPAELQVDRTEDAAAEPDGDMGPPRPFLEERL